MYFCSKAHYCCIFTCVKERLVVCIGWLLAENFLLELNTYAKFYWVPVWVIHLCRDYFYQKDKGTSNYSWRTKRTLPLVSEMKPGSVFSCVKLIFRVC